MPIDFSVEFHDDAAAEYDAAFDWYRERSPDAALKFDAEVDRAIAQIAEAPQRWASAAHSTRRFLLRRFPFVLIYRERASGDIQIAAAPTLAASRDTGSSGCSHSALTGSHSLQVFPKSGNTDKGQKPRPVSAKNAETRTGHPRD